MKLAGVSQPIGGPPTWPCVGQTIWDPVIPISVRHSVKVDKPVYRVDHAREVDLRPSGPGRVGPDPADPGTLTIISLNKLYKGISN